MTEHLAVILLGDNSDYADELISLSVFKFMFSNSSKLGFLGASQMRPIWASKSANFILHLYQLAQPHAECILTFAVTLDTLAAGF